MGSSASQSEFEVNNIATSLNNKADKDFSNVEEPVERFKDMVIEWILPYIEGAQIDINILKGNVMDWVAPDWSRKANRVKDTQYTADQGGWILFTSEWNGGSPGYSYLYVNGIEVDYDAHNADADDQHFFVPIAKGDTYKVTATESVRYYYFLPMKGYNS